MTLESEILLEAVRAWGAMQERDAENIRKMGEAKWEPVAMPNATTEANDISEQGTENTGFQSENAIHHCVGCRCDEILAVIAELKEGLRAMPYESRVDAEWRAQLEDRK